MEQLSKENRTISGLWIGNSFSILEQASIQSFLKQGHEFNLYTYETVKNIPTGTTVKDANLILPQKNVFTYDTNGKFGHGSYASFANLFRYLLLYRNGGWWADLDVICLNPWNIYQPAVIYTETIPKITPMATVLKFNSGSELMRLCYGKSLLVAGKKQHWGQTGSVLLKAMINAFPLAKDYLANPLWFGWVNSINAKERLFACEEIPEQVYGVHLFRQYWKEYNWTLKSFNKKSLVKNLLSLAGV